MAKHNLWIISQFYWSVALYNWELECERLYILGMNSQKMGFAFESKEAVSHDICKNFFKSFFIRYQQVLMMLLWGFNVWDLKEQFLQFPNIPPFSLHCSSPPPWWRLASEEEDRIHKTKTIRATPSHIYEASSLWFIDQEPPVAFLVPPSISCSQVFCL